MSKYFKMNLIQAATFHIVPTMLCRFAGFSFLCVCWCRFSFEFKYDIGPDDIAINISNALGWLNTWLFGLSLWTEHHFSTPMR